MLSEASRLAQKKYRDTHKEQAKEKRRQKARERAALKPPIPNLCLTPTEAAYIAGFFDGEGMVSISKDINNVTRGQRTTPNFVLTFKLSNSDKPVLDWIATKLTGWVMEIKTPGPRRHWTFVQKGNAAKRNLEALLPYLQVKREQAEKAIEFQIRQSSDKTRYESGRTGPVPRTADEIAYKQHYFEILRDLKKPRN